MTDRELMQMVLDALSNFDKGNHGMRWQVPLIKALRARLSQLEPTNHFNPDWDAIPVMVEEQQRMAKRIEELESQLGEAMWGYGEWRRKAEALEQTKREWVGLTDDEKHSAIWTGGEFGDGMLWAEKLLKEKNT